MMELHIEQSVVLDSKGLAIGVVEAIAGIKQFLVSISGVSNHAGATPMSYRFDALQGAVRIISRVEEIARGTSERSVATVGSVNCEPGLANVIPGRVEFTLDLRAANSEDIHRMEQRVRKTIEATCEERKLSHQLRQRSDTAPIALSGEVIALVEKVAREAGVETLRMVSGALHDSSILAELTKVGMIFVPSRAGRSHCPEEFTDLKDIKTGTDILLASVIELAG
jgi:allantoate deiminase